MRSDKRRWDSSVEHVVRGKLADIFCEEPERVCVSNLALSYSSIHLVFSVIRMQDDGLRCEDSGESNGDVLGTHCTFGNICLAQPLRSYKSKLHQFYSKANLGVIDKAKARHWFIWVVVAVR